MPIEPLVGECFLEVGIVYLLPGHGSSFYDEERRAPVHWLPTQMQGSTEQQGQGEALILRAGMGKVLTSSICMVCAHTLPCF